MKLVYLAYRKRLPWQLTWYDPTLKRRRTQSLASQEAAESFQTALEQRIERERILLKQARQKRVRQAKTAAAWTVRDIVEGYLALQCTHPTTQQANRYHLAPLLALYGDRRATTLTHEDMTIFAEIQQGRGIALSTINRRIAILKAALNWGVRANRLRASPLTGLRLQQARSRRIAPPTCDELRAMLTVAPAHIQRIILLGLYTGARVGPSELFRLRWSDMDFAAGVVRMPAARKSEGMDAHDIPVRPDLLIYLRAWYDADTAAGVSHVIHYRGRPVQRVGHAWRAALAAAGITRRIRPYDLRHAFASYALAQGSDLGTVATIMRHTDTSMVLNVYQHVSQAQQRAVVCSLPSLFSQAPLSIPAALPAQTTQLDDIIYLFLSDADFSQKIIACKDKYLRCNPQPAHPDTLPRFTSERCSLSKASMLIPDLGLSKLRLPPILNPG